MNLPNKLTIGRIIAVPFFILLYITEHYIIAAVLFILAAITDMLDGKIARRMGLVSNFGKIMDPLADKILVYSAFCLFVGDGIVKPWMFIIILAREFAIAGMRTVAASSGKVIPADMSGKIKTVVQMISVPVTLIWLFLTPYPGVKELEGAGIFGVLSKILIWASVILTVYSGADYIIKNKDVFQG